MFRSAFTQASRSVARAAPSSTSASATTFMSSRSYASAPAGGSGSSGSSSNIPLLAAAGGAVGLGAWYATGGLNSQGADKAKQRIDAVKQQVGAAKPSALNKDAFEEFTLKEIKPYNHDSATLVFELPEGKSSGLSVASAVVFKAVDDSVKDDQGKPVIRPYTPVTAPETEGHIDFLVKKYPNGKMTTHLHNLKPGDKLGIKGPIEKYQLKTNEFKEIGLIAGGSGITPMWQVIQKVVEDPADHTKVTLIYANKTQEDILLREEFDRLAKEKPEQFTVVYGTDKGPAPAGGFQGYITNELLRKHLPLPGEADKIKLFVCGPPGQVEVISGGKGPKGSQGDLKGILADLGYSINQVYKF